MYGEIVHIQESDYKNEASLQLMKLVVEKKRELDACFVIVETALYLLWAHIDYFTLQGIPTIGSPTDLNVSSCKYIGTDYES